MVTELFVHFAFFFNLLGKCEKSHLSWSSSAQLTLVFFLYLTMLYVSFYKEFYSLHSIVSVPSLPSV